MTLEKVEMRETSYHHYSQKPTQRGAAATGAVGGNKWEQLRRITEGVRCATENSIALFGDEVFLE